MAGWTSNYQTSALLIILWIILLRFWSPRPHAVPHLRMVFKPHLPHLSLGLIFFLWDPHMYVIKFVFLLLICFMSMWLLGQPKIEKRRWKLFLPFTEQVIKRQGGPSWEAVSSFPFELTEKYLSRVAKILQESITGGKKTRNERKERMVFLAVLGKNTSLLTFHKA